MGKDIGFTQIELEIIKQALIEMPQFAEARGCQLSAIVSVERQRALGRLDEIKNLY